jgi:hypothetical protein
LSLVLRKEYVCLPDAQGVISSVTIPKGITSSKYTYNTSTPYDFLTLINIVYVLTVIVITNNRTVSHSCNAFLEVSRRFILFTRRVKFNKYTTPGSVKSWKRF